MHEINQAPLDAWVIIVLYQNHIPISLKLVEILEELRKEYPNVKFLRSVATKCIENYIDADCPGILIYKNGELEGQMIPALKDLGGLYVNREIVEFVLGEKGIIETSIDVDPREELMRMHMKIIKKKNKRAHEESDESDNEDDREYMHNAIFKSYK